MSGFARTTACRATLHCRHPVCSSCHPERSEGSLWLECGPGRKGLPDAAGKEEIPLPARGDTQSCRASPGLLLAGRHSTVVIPSAVLVIPSGARDLFGLNADPDERGFRMRRGRKRYLSPLVVTHSHVGLRPDYCLQGDTPLSSSRLQFLSSRAERGISLA